MKKTTIDNSRDYSNAFRSLHAMKAKKAELEKQIKDLQAQIMEAMKAQGVQEVTAGGYTGKYSTFTTSRLDTAKLKKDYAELYAEYSKEDLTTRFTLK